MQRKALWIGLTVFAWLIIGTVVGFGVEYVLQFLPFGAEVPFAWAPSLAQVGGYVAIGFAAFYLVRVVRTVGGAPSIVWLAVLGVEVLRVLPSLVATATLAFGGRPDWVGWFVVTDDAGPVAVTEQLGYLVSLHLLPAAAAVYGAWMGSRKRDARGPEPESARI